MGSLFDIAAGLSQYDGASNTVLLASSTESGLSHENITIGKHRDLLAATTATNSNQDVDDPIAASTSVLSLLDDTLLTIYVARQPQSTSNRHAQQPRALAPQRSAPQLMLGHSTTKAVDKQDLRLRSSHAAPMPLQNVFAQSLPLRSASVRVVPPPPHSPPPSTLSSSVVETIKSPTGPTQDPDVVARKTLSEVQDELDQIPIEAVASPTRRQRLQRSLTDKYLHHRLVRQPILLPLLPLASLTVLARVEQAAADAIRATRPQEDAAQNRPPRKRENTTDDRDYLSVYRGATGAADDLSSRPACQAGQVGHDPRQPRGQIV
jgi:hypothetical protein